MVLQYTIILIVFSFSLLAQNTENPTKNSNSTQSENLELTQQRIRELKKYEIAGGINGLKQKLPFLRFGYNLSSRFSIGYTHFHQKKESTEPFLLFPIQNLNIGQGGITNSNPNAPSGVSMTEKRNSTELGLLGLRYYLSDAIPLYATAGIGRDYVGSKTVTSLYGDIYPSGGFRANPSYILSNDISPHYVYFLGIGFQWVFENGFFLGYEILRLQSINQKMTNYISNYQATPYENFLLSFINKGMSYETHNTFQLRNFCIGYSTSL